MDNYLFKTSAIERIWFLMNRSAKKEMKRAMTIWKLRKQFNIYKLRRLRELVATKINTKTKKAFLRWQSQSELMHHCVRVRIL
jgi:predicted RNA-binding protein